MTIDALIDRWSPGEMAKSRFNSLVCEARLNGEKLLLIKPMTFMNRSGDAVAQCIRYFKLVPESDLLIIVDDVTIPMGQIRFRSKGSAGTHNGLSNIEQRLGTQEYNRMRIGIDEPGIIPRIDYVLGKLTVQQRDTFHAEKKRICDAVQIWLTEGVNEAMNKYNIRKVRKPRNKMITDESGQSTKKTDLNENPEQNEL